MQCIRIETEKPPLMVFCIECNLKNLSLFESYVHISPSYMVISPDL